MEPESTCELCEREIELTKHHLIPRKTHKKSYVKKRFTKEECEHNILWVCRDCHSQIHATLTESELAKEYYTKELLLEEPSIKKFVIWVRKHKPKSHIKVRRSRN